MYIMEKFNVTGQELVVGECYMYKGKNMGKFISFENFGRAYDKDEKYTFEKGVLIEFLYSKPVFTKVPCSLGGARRKRLTRKRLSRRRKSKRTRRNRSSKKHKR